MPRPQHGGKRVLSLALKPNDDAIEHVAHVALSLASNALSLGLLRRVRLSRATQVQAA